MPPPKIRIRLIYSLAVQESLEAVPRTAAFARKHNCRYKAMAFEREPERSREYCVTSPSATPVTIFEVAEGRDLHELHRFRGLRTQEKMAPELTRARRRLTREVRERT